VIELILLNSMRDQVFISYSHRDQDYLNLLQVHLDPYIHGKMVQVWDDTKIKPGADWKQEIEKAIASAKVAVLLVSPYLLASPFIRDHELPELLDAAHTEGLIVILVAVRSSSFEITELRRYQAVNSPSRPLDHLGEAEQHDELVKICRLIEEAINSDQNISRQLQRSNPSSPHTLHPSIPEPNLGYMVYKTCNRLRQVTEFRRSYIARFKSRYKLPQVYLVHGAEMECHHSLIERLIDESITPFAKDQWGEQRKHITQEKIEWPYGSDLSELKDLLKIRLFTKFNPYYAEEDLSAGAFSRLPQISAYRIVIIQHDIFGANWNRGIRDLVEWYLQFWSEIQTDPLTRIFIIFLNIIYPRIELTKRWNVWSVFKQKYHQRIRDDLVNLSKTESGSCSCHLLSELSSPKQYEVKEWFRINNICSEKDGEIHSANIFRASDGKPIDSKSMADVEDELKRIVEHTQRRVMRGRPKL
jgi:inactive STAND/TIR domain